MTVRNESPLPQAHGRYKSRKCSYCDRKFKRSEHCARHERGHRQERPFSCRYCLKMYARKDLVKRHERTLHASQFQADQSADGQRVPDQPSLPQSPPLSSTDQTASNDACPDGAASTRSGGNTPADNGNLEGMMAQVCSPLNHPYSGTPAAPLTDTLELSLCRNLETVAEGITYDDQTATVESPAMDLEGVPVRTGAMAMQQLSTSESGLSASSYSTGSAILGFESDVESALKDFTTHALSHPLNADVFGDLMIDGCYDPSMETVPLNLPTPDSSEPIDHPWINNSSFSFPHEEPASPLQQRCNSRALQMPPRDFQMSPARVPRLQFDHAAYEALQRKITGQLGDNGGLQQLVSAKDIQHFLNSYVDCFHRHLPFIHVASFSSLETPSLLILAISSIGALYRLDRRKAQGLFDLATRIGSKLPAFPSPHLAMGNDSLWLPQAKVLLSLYAFFNGDSKTISDAFFGVSYYTIEYRNIRVDLKMNPPGQYLSWQKWIARESKRRLLCAIYILSNLVVTTYDVTPGVVNNADLEFEAPEHEAFWNARNEAEWIELGNHSAKPRCRTVREIMTAMIGESNDLNIGDRLHEIPTFTMLVIMHAVCVHIWLSSQYSHVLGSAFHMPARRCLRLAMLANTSSTLKRCEEVIMKRAGQDQETLWDSPEGPLLFNCQALLRIANARQFNVVQDFNRLDFFSPDPSVVLDAVSAYASAGQTRNRFLTAAVARSCEGFLSIIQVGHMLVRKTAALNWSVEHAISGWDSALFITKWIHTVECEANYCPPDADEQKLLSQIKSHLAEMEFQHEVSRSLASSLAKAWSLFLNDVWVWGVTPKMGRILESLSEKYQQRLESIRCF